MPPPTHHSRGSDGASQRFTHRSLRRIIPEGVTERHYVSHCESSDVPRRAHWTRESPAYSSVSAAFAARTSQRDPPRYCKSRNLLPTLVHRVSFSPPPTDNSGGGRWKVPPLKTEHGPTPQCPKCDSVRPSKICPYAPSTAYLPYLRRIIPERRRSTALCSRPDLQSTK